MIVFLLAVHVFVCLAGAVRVFLLSILLLSGELVCWSVKTEKKVPCCVQLYESKAEHLTFHPSIGWPTFTHYSPTFSPTFSSTFSPTFTHYSPFPCPHLSFSISLSSMPQHHWLA
ncbi:hypothetical protein I3843_03G226600 [Carya illinoinensis]|nr:hypothetical protein I3843_03G226600 [Carya illinoinensis]